MLCIKQSLTLRHIMCSGGSLQAFLCSRFSLATMPEEDDFDVVYGIPSCFTKSVMNGIIKRNNWGYHKKSDWLWQRVQEMK